MYMYVPVFWRTELNYLENKNGRGWMQLGEGRGFMVRLICGSIKSVGRRFQTTMPFQKRWLGGVTILLIKTGIT